MNRNPYPSSRPRSRFDDGRAPQTRSRSGRERYDRAPEPRRPQASRDRQSQTRYGTAQSRTRYGTARPQTGQRPRNATGAARRPRATALPRRFSRPGGEASIIIRRSALFAAVLALLLGIFFIIKPHLDLGRASRMTGSGDPAQAEAYLNRLEREGRSPQRLESLRAQLVRRYIDEGNFDGATSLISQLSSNENAQILRQEVDYARAAALYAEGSYEAAAQLFYQLGDYGDAHARYAESRCAMAVSAYLAGNENQARYLLLDTDDANLHIDAAALAVTGDAQQAGALRATELFSAANLQQMAVDKQSVSAARTEAAHRRLAAGYRHTVGLKSDGTVVTTGSNDSGQCDVLGWTNIIEVAAGASHTVGLKSDGTVLAVGDNGYGQCDVSDWADIRFVAASAYGTFGLKSDGSVVATRSYADKVSGWHGVTQLAAGGYSAGGLYGQGSMVCTHPGAQLDMGASLFGLSVCDSVSAALLPDGSLFSNDATAPAWHGLTQIIVSQTGMIGVFSDGACRGFTFRDGQDTALNISGQVVEAASSGTHHVVLTDDGRLYAFGENGDGQCDVSDWQL